tara:strand:- start:463 stop:693 length:231 start_codon:yes stop_codon:yes gene_type:complete
MAKDSREIVITLIREAISALKDDSLSSHEAEALLKGLAEALRAVIEIVPNWWAKAVLRVAAQVMDEAAAEIDHGAS